MSFKTATYILSLCLVIIVIRAQVLGSCDPIAPKRCLLPFPNDFWSIQDTTTDTGKRLRFAPDSFPADKSGVGIDPTEWNELDGFSPVSPIMSFFQDLSLANVPPHKNIALSELEDCPTVILDTETLQRVPHWGELDYSTEHTEDRTFMMWPASRLVSGRRYIVAIRNLRNETTDLVIEPSREFQMLRDNLTSINPDIFLRRDHFNNEIFAFLEEAGIPRNNLQLAWDFTVGSTSSITGRLLSMRDDALSRLPEDGPNYYITDVKHEANQWIYRTIHGLMEIPYYTNSTGPNSHLVIGSDGKPVFQGFTNTSFTVQIPKSLVEKQQSGMVLQYGHGLFGDQKEIEGSTMSSLAGEYGYVLAATNWWGMDHTDSIWVTRVMATNLTNVGIIPDRSQQGIVNFLVLTRLMKGSFAKDPNTIIGGVAMIDPTRVGYNGNSQGGIYGGTFMSVSQDITQGVLGVPGAPYVLMLPRSVDFNSLWEILKFRYPNAIDRIELLSVIQLLWDRSDPAGYMSHTVLDPLPDTPAKQIIIQYSLGDSQVSWLAALEMGRSMGAYMFPDNVQEDEEVFYGFPIAKRGVTTAVIQGWDYGSPDVPQTNTPPPAWIDTHECARNDPRARDQMYTFYTEGVIKDFCSGPCNGVVPPNTDLKCAQPF